MSGYMVVDIETCPINPENVKDLPEEDQKKLINPVDSKIVAIGMRVNGTNTIFFSEDEKTMLQDFWLEWKTTKRGNPGTAVVGFNILDFDIPFLITRSLVNNVPIAPFMLKEILDLREKISAYKYGPKRGTLKEFASLIGLETQDMNGAKIMKLCLNGEKDKIKSYLEKDLIITDQLYQRCEDLNITKIVRW